MWTRRGISGMLSPRKSERSSEERNDVDPLVYSRTDRQLRDLVPLSNRAAGVHRLRGLLRVSLLVDRGWRIRIHSPLSEGQHSSIHGKRYTNGCNRKTCHYSAGS